MSLDSTPRSTIAPSRAALAQLGGLAAVMIWAYWPMLSVFFEKWVHDPQYSHGFLVPLFSGYLVWRAFQNGVFEPRPMPVLGFALLALVVGMRLVSGALLFHQLDALTFLLGLAGCGLVAGGMPLLKRTWPAIAFLVFMIPLPYELERNVGQPLKTAATVSSTYLLQTLGQPALRDGNLILIDETKLGVVDACSGLKMMMTFAAFSIGAVLLMKRTRFEKLMVLLGIAPIAVIANVLRITGTGLILVWFGEGPTYKVCHDLFGWLMMPVGLGLLALELWALKRLVVDDSTGDPIHQSNPGDVVPGFVMG